MPSKFDRLRSGEVVEIEPGRKGRLDLASKTFQTSDGRKVYVGDDEDFFPSNEKNLALSKQKEKLERGVRNTPGGEFLHQFGETGILGGAKDWANRLVMKGDEYLTNKQASQQVGEDISRRSPGTSAAATVAGFIPDLALTRGMSALKAAPLITGLSAGSRVLDEPGRVAAETGVAAVGGKLIDKGAGYLQKMASRRALSRQVGSDAQKTGMANLLGESQTNASNQAAKEAFARETQFAQRENSARMHQYNLEVSAREKEMLRSKQAYNQAQASHSANVNTLKQEANSAQKSYEEAIRKLPEVQAQAQKEFSEGLKTTFEDIENAFPKGSQIPVNDLSLDDFYQSYIQKNALIGTSEARKAEKLFKNLFPENQAITPREFADRLRAVEAAIGKASPEGQKLLTELKSHLSQKAPTILGESIVSRATMPSILKAVDGELSLIFKSQPFKSVGISNKAVEGQVKQSLREYLGSMNPRQLAAKAKSGEIAQDLRDQVFPYKNYESMLGNKTNLTKLKRQGMLPFLEKSEEYQAMPKAYDSFITNLADRTENVIARTQLQGVKEAGVAKGNLTRKLNKTKGMAEPVSAPLPPDPLTLPQGPVPPTDLASPINPVLMEKPSAPIPQRFSPQQIPTLPEAQGGLERTADFLEKPLLQGKGNMNSLLKLGALKYALGSAALPLEGAGAGLYGAGKLLTSPGAVGEGARLSFKTAGIKAIEWLAQKYPSYHDGVLENPQERRSLTKEIENDQEIPLEQKAVIQSKINRGTSIFQKLQ